MEDRTSVMCMYLDDLGIGVKSQSSPAMAGSCRNMPQYSLIVLASGVKLRIRPAGPQGYGVPSNSEPVGCIRWEWGAGRKVLFRNANKRD